MKECNWIYLCQACTSGLSQTKWEDVRGAVKEAQMQMCTCVVSQTIWKQTFFGPGITKAFSTLGSSSSTNKRILLDNNFNLCSALIYFQPSIRSCSVVSPQGTLTEKYVCKFPVKCTLSSVGYDHFCHDPWQVLGYTYAALPCLFHALPPQSVKCTHMQKLQ